MNNLTLARARAGLSQRELAKRAGVNRISVYRIEGGFAARDTTLVALARALGWPEARCRELMDEVDIEAEDGPQTAA